ncbi:MAG: DoxX family protein [Paracoccaceae bacterium]|nr:DoxX family protein [Paracoccaceae bacterium]MDP7185684.1 DoxX family protein [Paracoccaceae bacterium]
MKYVTIGIKALLSLAFLAAGLAKLSGVEMMVGTFDAIGIGQWFRYVTALIEIGAAILLWVPGLVGLGASLLTATMIGAVLTHFLIIGPSAVPAFVLGVLSAFIAWQNRADVPVLGPMLKA